MLPKLGQSQCGKFRSRRHQLLKQFIFEILVKLFKLRIPKTKGENESVHLTRL